MVILAPLPSPRKTDGRLSGPKALRGKDSLKVRLPSFTEPDLSGISKSETQPSTEFTNQTSSKRQTTKDYLKIRLPSLSPARFGTLLTPRKPSSSKPHIPRDKESQGTGPPTLNAKSLGRSLINNSETRRHSGRSSDRRSSQQDRPSRHTRKTSIINRAPPLKSALKKLRSTSVRKFTVGFSDLFNKKTTNFGYVKYYTTYAIQEYDRKNIGVSKDKKTSKDSYFEQSRSLARRATIAKKLDQLKAEKRAHRGERKKHHVHKKRVPRYLRYGATRRKKPEGRSINSQGPRKSEASCRSTILSSRSSVQSSNFAVSPRPEPVYRPIPSPGPPKRLAPLNSKVSSLQMNSGGSPAPGAATYVSAAHPILRVTASQTARPLGHHPVVHLSSGQPRSSLPPNKVSGDLTNNPKRPTSQMARQVSRHLNLKTLPDSLSTKSVRSQNSEKSEKSFRGSHVSQKPKDSSSGNKRLSKTRSSSSIPKGVTNSAPSAGQNRRSPSSQGFQDKLLAHSFS